MAASERPLHCIMAWDLECFGTIMTINTRMMLIASGVYYAHYCYSSISLLLRPSKGFMRRGEKIDHLLICLLCFSTCGQRFLAPAPPFNASASLKWPLLSHVDRRPDPNVRLTRTHDASEALIPQSQSFKANFALPKRSVRFKPAMHAQAWSMHHLLSSLRLCATKRGFVLRSAT